MSKAVRVQKSNVMVAMTMIRPLLKQRGCDVDAYTDDEIADALLDTCFDFTPDWLSPAHVARASQRLSAQVDLPLAEPPSAKRSIAKLKSETRGSS